MWSLISVLIIAGIRTVASDWLSSLLPEPLTFMSSNVALGGLFALGILLIWAEVRALAQQRPWVTRERLWRNWKGPLFAASGLFVVVAIITLTWRIAEVKLLSVQGMSDQGGRSSFLNRLFGHQTAKVLAQYDDLLDHGGTTAFWFYSTRIEGKIIFNRFRLMDFDNENSKKKLEIYLQTVNNVNYLTVDMSSHDGRKSSQSADISEWKDKQWHQVTVTWTQPPQQSVSIYVGGQLAGQMNLQDFVNNIPERTQIAIYR
jgi:Concanavalin A-like lectin/glucanases superfamily